jgi:hypothetical protein
MPVQKRQVLHGLSEIILASPRFAIAPLIRRRHLRWGATDAEVAAPMPGDDLVPRSSGRLVFVAAAINTALIVPSSSAAACARAGRTAAGGHGT